MKRIATAVAVLAATVALGSGTPADAQTEEPILGPDGYKALHIGQPGPEAEATGLLVNKQPGTCDRYYLHPNEGEQNIGSGVFIDPTLGVVVIGGTTLSRTPEGVTMGSTLDAVRAAYPDLTPVPPTDFVYSSPVPDHPGLHYRFAFSEANQVSDFALHAENMGACASDTFAQPREENTVEMWEDPGGQGDRYVEYQPGTNPDDKVDIDGWNGDGEISSVSNDTEHWLMIWDEDDWTGNAVCVRPNDSITNLESVGFDNSAQSFELASFSFC